MAGKKSLATEKLDEKVKEAKPGSRLDKRLETCFKPGQSGNPSGRPKVPQTVKALAREFTDISIRRLASIVQDKGASPAAQVQAAQALLDRGWGKPLQQLEVGEAGAFSDMDEAAIDLYIAETTAQLARLAPPDEENRIN
jgi:Family of unknown function (DUF5681)